MVPAGSVWCLVTNPIMSANGSMYTWLHGHFEFLLASNSASYGTGLGAIFTCTCVEVPMAPIKKEYIS